MTRHIATRNKLKSIALREQFETLLARTTLKDDEKTILRMHYMEHKEFDFIADMMGYSEWTAKRKHKEALVKLSSILLDAD